MFMFNNGTSDYKSDERAIEGECAYWWEGPANVEAGDAIEFLVYAEARRNAATDYSVCNVSKENAKAIVGMYNAFDNEVRETYIDCTTVWTYKVNPKARVEDDENELVSYKKVVEELGKIAEMDVEGSNIIIRKSNANFDTQTIIIIASIVVASMVGLTVLHIVRRRAHN